ncbi:hypothetical protein [Nonomuraea sp. NPDC050786]|uniref:hypothetical protein n=1 Tax=Nonomuraea sp. NPDC050786 TaxID=3154840 RepID=UPI0033D4C349
MALDRARRAGAYTPLSVSYYKDDDIAIAGEAAELLFVRGLAFCGEMMSDGFISDIQLVRFVGVGMTDAKERAEKLVETGLWLRVEGGYQVRSWLKWNKSAEEIRAYRTTDRARKAKKTAIGVHAEDGAESERNPDGSRADSDSHSTTQHDTSSSAEPPTEVVELRQDVERLCVHLADRIVKNGSKRPKITREWRNAARLMLDRDGHTEEQVHSCIDWCQDDPFWQTTILSMPKLRLQYDQLRLKARNQAKVGHAAPPPDTPRPRPRDAWMERQ